MKRGISVTIIASGKRNSLDVWVTLGTSSDSSSLSGYVEAKEQLAVRFDLQALLDEQRCASLSNQTCLDQVER